MKKLNSCPRESLFFALFVLFILPFNGHGQFNPVTGSTSNYYFTGTNLGIGTASNVAPAQKLVLQGSSTLWFRMHNMGTNGGFWSMGPSDDTWSVKGGKFIISNNEASLDAAFTIDAARSVGIGQTTLTAAGGSNARLTILAGVQNSQAVADWGIKLQNGAPGGTEWLIGSSATGWDIKGGKFVINTGTATSSLNSPFVIDAATGNIGISQPSPFYKLDVNGIASATQIVVGVPSTAPAASYQGYKLAVGGKAIAEEVVVKLQANWPDYVFESTYKLPSLLEIDRYIRENKHLPEMPTAQEVQQNGLSIGEMNALLLKKIEELTLYVVDLKKESMESQKKVAELQKEIEMLKNK